MSLGVVMIKEDTCETKNKEVSTWEYCEKLR